MLEPGESLSGRYRIERVLGKGGMGAVYLGVMESLGGKKVAIKEMEFTGEGHRTKDQALEQFRTEASFLAHLDHPNLVQVTDFFAEGDKHYLVMAYVQGQTLQQRIEELQRPLDWAEMKPRVEALLDVLGYLHAQNPPIIFRDLKPSNVMIEASGQLKLIDFGIARTAQPGQETCTFLKGTGTSGFSPIEQYGMGESTDQRSDIYAFGATVYYLLTGKVPPDAVKRVSSGKALKPPSDWNPGIPAYLDGILARCLGVRQNDRYNTVGEIQRELKLVQDTLSEAVETIDMSLYSENQRLVPGAASSSSPFATLVASLVCLIAVFGLAFYWEDLLQELQPVEVVAEVEQGEEPEMRPEPDLERKVDSQEKPKERNPYAYIKKLPDKTQPAVKPQPKPKTTPTRRPVAVTQPRPQPRLQPNPAPKPKLDIGTRKYPKAPPKEQTQPTQPEVMPASPGEVVFYETRPDGQRVRIRPDDPRIPLLRKQWRQRYQQQR
ncbi:MAG: protein kinase [Candidatus Eremiobacteraeota bacterium]|nr:protein kinase [Candidatus Eremiobacteraeota bacterium]